MDDFEPYYVEKRKGWRGWGHSALRKYRTRFYSRAGERITARRIAQEYHRDHRGVAQGPQAEANHPGSPARCGAQPQ